MNSNSNMAADIIAKKRRSISVITLVIRATITTIRIAANKNQVLKSFHGSVKPRAHMKSSAVRSCTYRRCSYYVRLKQIRLD